MSGTARDSQSVAGSVIRDARAHKGLTQAAVAAQLGVTTATVSRWETGGSAVQQRLRESLCRLLEINPSELWERPNVATVTLLPTGISVQSALAVERSDINSVMDELTAKALDSQLDADAVLEILANASERHGFPWHHNRDPDPD